MSGVCASLFVAQSQKKKWVCVVNFSSSTLKKNKEAPLQIALFFPGTMIEAMKEVYGVWNKLYACKQGITAVRDHENALIDADVSESSYMHP